MTKEEIKLVREQYNKLEKSYNYHIKRLNDDLSKAQDEVVRLARENEVLRQQILTLQNGLTGEEVSYLKDR